MRAEPGYEEVKAVSPDGSEPDDHSIPDFLRSDPSPTHTESITRRGRPRSGK